MHRFIYLKGLFSRDDMHCVSTDFRRIQDFVANHGHDCSVLSHDYDFLDHDYGILCHDCSIHDHDYGFLGHDCSIHDHDYDNLYHDYGFHDHD
jgi:hypothetical protein